MKAAAAAAEQVLRDWGLAKRVCQTRSARIPKRILVDYLYWNAVAQGWIVNHQAGMWIKRNNRSRLVVLVKLHEQRGRCGICGVPFMAERPARISLDHIVPRAQGGSDGLANRQAAHKWCDYAKGDLMPDRGCR